MKSVGGGRGKGGGNGNFIMRSTFDDGVYDRQYFSPDIEPDRIWKLNLLLTTAPLNDLHVTFVLIDEMRKKSEF